MPVFTWRFHDMTLTHAIESQHPTELTVYAYNRHRRCFERVDTVPTVSEDEARELEANETTRRITHEQRFGREFADEMSDAEVGIVWQLDGHEFADAKLVTR